MIESILESIKRPLQLEADDDTFDDELAMHINSVFSTLHQIGAAPVDGFVITGPEEKWSDYLLDRKNVEMVKSYMYLRVKLLFDPPGTSFAITSMEDQIKQWEWRMQALELSFNPNAWVSPSSITGEVAEAPTFWTIDEKEPLPEDMKVGEVGYDPKTGNLVRKI